MSPATGRGAWRTWLAGRPHLVLLGAAVAGLVASPYGTRAAAGTGLVALAACAVLGLPRLGLIAAAIAAAAGLAGSARLAAIDSPGERLHDGDAYAGRAVLIERPRATRFGSRAVLELGAGPAAGARILAEAPGSLRWPPAISPGEELTAAGLLTRPGGPAGDGFDMAAYLRRRGLAAQLDLSSVLRAPGRRGGLAGAVDRARRRAERAIAAGISPERAALATGMVLGQDEAIAQPVRDDFKASGLAHLLAVSGQNVMLLCALAWPLAAAAGLGRRARFGLLLALIAAYVPLAGAGPSLQRAGIMGAAGIAAVALSRPASRVWALGLAAAVTLALNPRVASDPGWQLSFAAVAGILALGRPLARAAARAAGEGRIRRAAADGAAITLAATIATAPLMAYQFGSVSLAALPANVLALPAVAPVMWIGMVQAALGQLAEGPLEGPVLALCGALGHVSSVGLAWIETLATGFADLPWASEQLPSGSLLLTAAGYLAIGAVALAIRRAGRRADAHIREVPSRWRATPPAVRIAAPPAAALALAVLVWLLAAPPAEPDRLTVSFVDVGQGDATLIQAPGGTAVLFDGGRPEQRVARKLGWLGVRQLALVVATHQSADHHGGLAEVIDRFPVGMLLENGDGTRDPTYLDMVREADRRGVHHVPARAGQVLRIGELTIRILAPRPRPPGPPPADPNERAVVAIVSDGDFDLFLSADAESPSLLPLRLPRVDAMKVPHHGSADPGLPQVLARLHPQVAAIEVGKGNSYGHPTPSTLAALHAAVPRVTRADRDGTVQLTAEDGRLHVATGR